MSEISGRPKRVSRINYNETKKQRRDPGPELDITKSKKRKKPDIQVEEEGESQESEESEESEKLDMKLFEKIREKPNLLKYIEIYRETIKDISEDASTLFDYMNDYKINAEKYDSLLNYSSPIGIIALSEIIDFISDASDEEFIKKFNNLFAKEEGGEIPTPQDIKAFTEKRLKLARPADGNERIQLEQQKIYGQKYITKNTQTNASKVKLESSTMQATPYEAIKEKEGLCIVKKNTLYTILDKKIAKFLYPIYSHENIVQVCLYCGYKLSDKSASSHQLPAEPAFLNLKASNRYGMNFVSCCAICNSLEAYIPGGKGVKRLINVKEELGSEYFKRKTPTAPITAPVGSTIPVLQKKERGEVEEQLLNTKELQDIFDNLMKNIDIFNPKTLLMLSKPSSELSEELEIYKNRLGKKGLLMGVWVINKIILENFYKKSESASDAIKMTENLTIQLAESKKEYDALKEQIKESDEISSYENPDFKALEEEIKTLESAQIKSNEIIKIIMDVNKSLSDALKVTTKLNDRGPIVLAQRLKQAQAYPFGMAQPITGHMAQHMTQPMTQHMTQPMTQDMTQPMAQDMTRPIGEMNLPYKKRGFQEFKEGKGKTVKRKKRFENIKKKLPKTMKRLNKIKLKGLKGLNTIRQTLKNKKNKIRYALTVKNKQKKSKLLKLKKPSSKKDKKQKTFNRKLIINRLIKKPKSEKK